jgi:hypothetical protein
VAFADVSLNGTVNVSTPDDDEPQGSAHVSSASRVPAGAAPFVPGFEPL